MDVHAGSGPANSRTDLHVSLAGETRLDASLHADLGRAAIPGFARAPGDFVERQGVRATAQVLAQLPFRERAELALEVADVGVVDVAADDVRDGVAAHLAPKRVGCRAYLGALVAARSKQPNEIGL